jgi:hypothetical protein
VSERLEQVLDPAFVDGIEGLDIDEVRARRAEGAEVETSLSYVRRLAQGRLDILVAELQRRAVGDDTRVEILVAQLGEILAGDKPQTPGAGRFPSLMAPAPDDDLVAELENLLSDRTMGDLPGLSDEEAISLGEKLRDFERKVSDLRRTLHARLAVLEKEVVRRYKAGEASVDSLLAQ